MKLWLGVSLLSVAVVAGSGDKLKRIIAGPGPPGQAYGAKGNPSGNAYGLRNNLPIHPKQASIPKASVPIPGTLLLFGAGFGGLAAWQWRRSRKEETR